MKWTYEDMLFIIEKHWFAEQMVDLYMEIYILLNYSTLMADNM